tara:strand:+ start:667 stop:1335 length:669 start_codon:yes stop_codon:yes gene_type:complete
MYTGPHIVDNGLVFAVDAGSTRSYSGSGTTTTSLVGTNSGTLTNGVGFNSGNGGYWSFDGTDDYINFASYTSHQQNEGSIEGWVKPTNNGGNRYAFGAGGTATVGASRALRIAGGNWSVVGYGSGGTSGQDWNDIATATTNWQHVVITWSFTTYCFFLDGVKYSAARTGIITPVGSVLRIGAPPFATNSNFIGLISSLKCYGRVLNQDEVTQNYNAQKSRFL